MKHLLMLVGGLGPWGPIAFIGLYIVATILFIPGSILTMGAGFLFGFVHGAIYVSIAATLGATCAFLAGRYLARERVARRFGHNRKFKALDRALGREGWKIVGLARLSPIFPFNLLNYVFGLTDISLRDYFFASWAGMLPGIVMYVYIGTLARDLAGVGSLDASAGPALRLLKLAGLTATIALVAYVTHLAHRALRQKTRDGKTHCDNTPSVPE